MLMKSYHCRRWKFVALSICMRPFIYTFYVKECEWVFVCLSSLLESLENNRLSPTRYPACFGILLNHMVSVFYFSQIVCIALGHAIFGLKVFYLWHKMCSMLVHVYIHVVRFRNKWLSVVIKYVSNNVPKNLAMLSKCNPEQYENKNRRWWTMNTRLFLLAVCLCSCAHCAVQMQCAVHMEHSPKAHSFVLPKLLHNATVK